MHRVTRHLARRLAGERVTVNAVAPGLFATAMTAELLAEPAQRELLVAAIPLGRLGGRRMGRMRRCSWRPGRVRT